MNAIEQTSVRGHATLLPDEVAVSMVYNGSSQAVMMATPDDLDDLAWGFAMTEGFLTGLADVDRFELQCHGTAGKEARFWLVPDRATALEKRRRRMLGPVGCGMCGIDSLQQALRPVPHVGDTDFSISRSELSGVTEALRLQQGDGGGGLHAAGFYRPGEGFLIVREDVGRHNAVDKVCGALLRQRLDPRGGALVVTSRVSVDLVQKAAMIGAPMLIAISSPTQLAVDTANAAGLTLVARARRRGYQVHAHPARIT